MQSHRSLGLPASARWLAVAISVTVIVATSVSAQATTAPATTTVLPPPTVADSSVRPAAIPGIPTLPDVVTVVPFQLFQETGWIYVQAELDGHRGTYSIDTGSARFWLNPHYFRPSATGGIDTVTAQEAPGTPMQGFVTVHTLRIGTFVQHLDTTGVGPPVPRGPTNGNIMDFVGNELGTLGLPALEPFEMIIDYPHQRLILIRLDKKGRRLAAVPAYTPAGTVPLVPISPQGEGLHWWGLAGRRGGVRDSVDLDTGSPGQSNRQIQANAAQQLKQAIATGHDASTISLDGIARLGYTFLQPLGVVGFNLRTRQLILYR